MFQEGDLVIDISLGVTYRFKSYINYFDDDFHDCELFETELSFREKKGIRLVVYRCSLDYWFAHKRYVLIEKIRTIKRIEVCGTKAVSA